MPLKSYDAVIDMGSNTIRLMIYKLNAFGKDNVKARIQDSKGIYHYVEKKPNEPFINSQQKLMQNPFSYM